MNNYYELPTITLRGIVIFPGTTLELEISRKKSLLALMNASENEQKIFLVTQKDSRDEDPSEDQLYDIGVIAEVVKTSYSGDKTLSITLITQEAAKKEDMDNSGKFPVADVEVISQIQLEDNKENDVILRTATDLFHNYVALNSNIDNDTVFEALEMKEDKCELINYMSNIIIADYKLKQKILSEPDPKEKLLLIIEILKNEIETLKLVEEIGLGIKHKMDKEHKEYVLREYIRLANSELDKIGKSNKEVDDYIKKIKKLNLKKEAEKTLIKECKRLNKMIVESQEASVIRGYLDTCLSLPWKKRTNDSLNLKKALKILNEDHYSLEKVKERVIELLAVRKLSNTIKGQVICLVGPPGVGKTSIAKSLAKAMHRKYVRVALGGVKDESEIRGHRRTYVASMPGRIIDAISKAKSKNPVLLLDEIDKLSSSYNGDPTSALLEVLDIEQNSSFHDHFIDVPFDLSETIFITTANDISEIPKPLLDRMDVITLSSYTPEEKFHIARRHLLPKQMKKCKIDNKMFKISDEAIRMIIDNYIRDAGVRGLERIIQKLLRKTAKIIVEGKMKKVHIKKSNINQFLGPQRYNIDKDEIDEIGIVKGLAWTCVGGEMLPIEAIIMHGDNKLDATGSLGDVMIESAQIALSFIRSHSNILGLSKDFFKKHDIHIHAPEGAIPKDGPSAGVTMATALISSICKIPVRSDTAMTGEITLHGKVLPIGGLKEKTMAAYKSGIKNVIIPRKNEPDLEEIDSIVKKNVNFILADSLKDVFSNSLVLSKEQQENIEKM